MKINEDVMENCNITLFAKEHLSDNEIVVVESLALAVIDTACSRTVCEKMVKPLREWFKQQ